MSVTATTAAVVVEVQQNPIIVGVTGAIVLVTALVTHAKHYCCDDRGQNHAGAHATKATGILLLIVGGALQLGLAPLCGFDAYEDCFRDCPLPTAPDFNHNALFHVLAFFAYVLYGVGELMLPAYECLTILRPKTTTNHELDKEEVQQPIEKV